MPFIVCINYFLAVCLLVCCHVFFMFKINIKSNQVILLLMSDYSDCIVTILSLFQILQIDICILSPFFMVSWKEVFLRQLSITDSQPVLNKHHSTCQGEGLCGSFTVCPVIDRKWNAGAARVIIPDITSRTIKLSAPAHAEKGGTTRVVQEEACRVSRHLIYWCGFIMRWKWHRHFLSTMPPSDIKE